MLAMTYDATTKIFNGYVEVADENSVPANATLVKPNGIVQPYTWDGAKWTGQSIDDWNTQNNNQESTPQPTVEQQQIAELIKSNAQQMALNAQLIKQLATLQTSQATQTAQAAQAAQAAQTQTTQEAK